MKALETLIVLGVVVAGGYVAIRMLQGRGNLTWLQGLMGPQWTRQQYIASPTTPGAIQPLTNNVSTPETRAKSTGGGVGGQGVVKPGAPPSNVILRYGGGAALTCEAGKFNLPPGHRCYAFKNSPGTCTACLRNSLVARKKSLVNQVRSFERYSYNAIKDSIRVV